MKVYQIIDERAEERRFIPEEDVVDATIGDMLDAGYSQDDCGIQEAGTKDDEELYTLDDDEKMTIEEIRKEDADMKMVKYWGGNNWKINIFEDDELVMFEVAFEQLESPSPAYYFRYLMKFPDQNDETIEVTQSNMSGSLSPYYEEKTQ